VKADFWDIESLRNVFLLSNYLQDENTVEIYYLADDPKLCADPRFAEAAAERVHGRNANFAGGSVRLYSLTEKEANVRLAETFGLSDAWPAVNDPDARSSYPKEFRIRCDTDPDYDDEKDPYFFGYNSYNYDTAMLSAYFSEAWKTDASVSGSADFSPVSAGFLRSVNNDLFSPQFRGNMSLYLTQKKQERKNGAAYFGPRDYRDPRYLIRRNMLLTGRHLDLARLNEKQRHVRLKRLLGTIGCQILESDRLASGQDVIRSADELYDLIAYNVSDCVNAARLFEQPLYQTQFSLKKQLLKTYPELIYQQKADRYEPDIAPSKVRRDRLMIDSSSAQFVTLALCPYGHLKDIETVSFDYPSREKAEELGVPVVNVLDETRKFFYSHFPQPELRRQFDEILAYYRSIEGKNFNSSKNYQMDYPGHTEVSPLESIPLTRSFLPYFDRDGNPTSCYANFSIGGVHGAEYNKALYEADLAEWEQYKKDLAELQEARPDPADCYRLGPQITLKDGRTVRRSQFLTGSSAAKAQYRSPEEKKPELFPNHGMKMNDRYSYTSADAANHEDFTSYYPNMLRMMRAFWNDGLGYDRYAEIFDQKQKYGRLMKDPSLTQHERGEYRSMREGTKLLLNSASGAGDTNYDSNIRMNNQIISMRAIGQMFTWRIGQAQAYEGSRIVSTNTDGLYSVMEEERNNEILRKESADIGVEIEPEVTYLISKDANNRLEFSNPDPDSTDGEITSAAGGTLACREGPNPSKALAHPAIVDWLLAEYLVAASKHRNGLTLADPFDEKLGMEILRAALDPENPRPEFDSRTKRLLMFQNMLASGSEEAVSFHFGLTDDDPGHPVVLLRDNRVFIMKDGTPGTYHLRAAKARVITAAMQKKRLRDGEPAQVIEPAAMEVLRANGIAEAPAGRDVKAENISGIDPDWYMLVENRDLYCLTEEEAGNILSHLDFGKYLELVRTAFDNNWRNHMPERTCGAGPGNPAPEAWRGENREDAGGKAGDREDPCSADGQIDLFSYFRMKEKN
jgi:hypothetical protein